MFRVTQKVRGSHMLGEPILVSQPEGHLERVESGGGEDRLGGRACLLLVPSLAVGPRGQVSQSILNMGFLYS